MSTSNGNGVIHHPFFGTTAFETVWRYFRCDRCRRTLVTVQTSRGDHPPQFKCTSMPGSKLVDGKPCEGNLMMNDERRMRDWPVYVRHQADGEWYHPTNDELIKMKRAAPRLWQYCKAGGMILRAPRGAFPWPIAGPQVPHEPVAQPLAPGTAACPDCGNPLDAHNRCAIHGDPNDPGDSDPHGVLLP